MMDVKDRVFVVTGGGNGMGREVVRGLIARGAGVAAVDLNEAGLAETVELAAAPYGKLTTHALNVTDREAVLALPHKVIEAHGQVDGLLNIAGIIHPFVEMRELDFDIMERVFNVNFWGVVNTTKAFLPELNRRPAAAVLNVASIGSLVTVPGQGAYGASKAAVKMFTEALYAENLDSNIAVTIVFPGGVQTQITANSGLDTERPGGDKPNKGSTQTSAADAGRQIIEGLEKGAFRVVIGNDARILDWFSRLSPRRSLEMVVKKTKEMRS